MKLAVTGKGGVGKTTTAALIIRHLAKDGKRVIAIDADPDANLASALGFGGTEKIVPIADMETLVEERTGAKPGRSGSFFTINPKVDDLPEKLWIEKGPIRLMVMGTVKKGGGGCVCPESALLKNLVSHVVLYRDDVVVMDMEAGIEHLGRGTATAVDMVIVVVEPGRRSVETAEKIRKLAQDLGIGRLGVVGNKVRGDADMSFIRENLPGMKVLGFIPFDERLIEADLEGREAPEEMDRAIDGILGQIISAAAG
ncbi:MAG TPA: carbon monoxide dehydrogenase accessory protein CooC [Spirochaetota bacterium]|nr:carbon monoxide dehydrogenase accessory protein CooC [Spirochaetota bacterium]HPC41926.1 carbon monoxide dehydrogenase accessory protein CooC [Spirochaetota bacterium]HPL17346.1 carbon monoxide dehydrogenase accessory protein CooC [Spirochaetota bacterium]HQF09636.1 carbon monoxide dehydrogenase accessory protein CooC [Spirochaetota bacterium]HQH98294.1 carbon monoxide dehydrogenase accessory protein CooC [Spirochaetota bacterium]